MEINKQYTAYPTFYQWNILILSPAGENILANMLVGSFINVALI